MNGEDNLKYEEGTTVRCLYYEDCVCGTPEINVNPNVEVFADLVRSNERERVKKRLDFLRLESDLPTSRGNDNERPSGLRYLYAVGASHHSWASERESIERKFKNGAYYPNLFLSLSSNRI
jgi:hypothetical protein